MSKEKRLVDANLIIETIDCSANLGGIMQPVVSAVYEYSKNLVSAMPTEFDEKAYSDGYAQATADANAAAESVNAENAIKAAKMIIKYCARFRLCGKHCIFYREGSAGCALEFPYDYDIKEEKADGGKA